MKSEEESQEEYQEESEGVSEDIHGSQTPMHSQATPIHGSLTPTHGSSAWRPSVADDELPVAPAFKEWVNSDAGSANRQGSGASSTWDAPDSHTSKLSPRGLSNFSMYSPQINSPLSSYGEEESFEKSDRVRATFGAHAGKEGKVTYIDPDTNDVHIKFRDGTKEIVARRDLEKI